MLDVRNVNSFVVRNWYVDLNISKKYILDLKLNTTNDAQVIFWFQQLKKNSEFEDSFFWNFHEY